MKSSIADFIREDCERVADACGSAMGNVGDAAILITGGTGFMGSWIAETIHHWNATKRANARVYLMGRDRERFDRNLGHLADDPAFSFIRCDARNVSDMPKDVNYVIHAAGTPDNRVHATSPVGTMVAIAEGTRAIVRAADRVSDLRMFVNVSSSAVYGPQPADRDLLREDQIGAFSCDSPDVAYAEAKRYGETLVNAARSESRLPAVTVRPFTFLGPFQPLDAPWAANNFIQDALSRRPIRLLGDGSTVRSFLYGADMAVWLLTIMNRAKTGRVYNVGSNEGVTLERVAGRIAAGFSPSPEVLLNASLTGRIPRSRLVPDTEAASKDFGLRRYTDLDTAIRRTVAWYRDIART